MRMLVKEYRICLPMAVEEYRIAQLYMLQKKSRDETTGSGSAVEIIKNEPYTNGPMGGSGQYTFKIYHIGSHMPSWFRAILPKSALRVEEEAWNAYPYTRTIYRCPFIEKFSLDVETYYFNDGGERENVFDLNKTEMKNRTVDYIDIVKDKVSSGDYKKDEDPKIFVSEKTARGPLLENWREEYAKAARDPNSGHRIMCAYKICRVEFKYWGMQNKIERFIHDLALRKTMLKAHRQAWCWQDEYQGMTLDDIRGLEAETQAILAKKVGDLKKQEEGEGGESGGTSVSAACNDAAPVEGALATSSADTEDRQVLDRRRHSARRTLSQAVSDLKELQESRSDDEDEFFDAHEEVLEDSEGESEDGLGALRSNSEESGPKTVSRLHRMLSDLTQTRVSAAGCARTQLLQQQGGGASSGGKPLSKALSASLPSKLIHQASSPALGARTISDTDDKAALLFLVFHGGSVIENARERPAKSVDLTTLKGTIERVARAHYPGALGRIAVRLVPCPFITHEALRLLARLSPFSHAMPVKNSNLESSISGSVSENVDTFFGEFFPLGAIPLYSANSSEYRAMVDDTVARANSAYAEFLTSCQGAGFAGQVCIIGDCNGSIVAYDAVCRPRSNPAEDTPPDSLSLGESSGGGATSAPPLRPNDSKASLSASENGSQPRFSLGSEEEGPGAPSLEFAVHSFFALGSPLGLVLAHRKIRGVEVVRPPVHQLYNLFHAIDPSATRLEPLVCEAACAVPPVQLSRYSRLPLGDGEPLHVVELVERNLSLFKSSSGSSAGEAESQGLGSANQYMAVAAQVLQDWWGSKRLDYAVYCPEAIQSFPTNTLPSLFHASFWESADAVAFILRQLMRPSDLQEGWREPGERAAVSHQSSLSSASDVFHPSPKRRWSKKKTSFKIKNLSANHRANDVIVLEGAPQTVTGKFMYGPLDMVALTGELVDLYVERGEAGSDDWQLVGGGKTDSSGKFSCAIPEDVRLPLGVFAARIIVRGDGTRADLSIAVMPEGTESVIFSIDGSFTASFSISGIDPKLRPGSVDVVRHYQERGYLVLYVTARPDLQQRRVVRWLAQHNFPHGMVVCSSGLSAEPLKHKTNVLRGFKEQAKLVYHAAYGSAKDISVYNHVGISSSNVYIIGKVPKKHQQQANVLNAGYAAHLQELASLAGPRAVWGSARAYISRGCFSLPGHRSSREPRPCAASQKQSARTSVRRAGIPLGREIPEEVVRSSLRGEPLTASQQSLREALSRGKHDDVS